MPLQIASADLSDVRTDPSRINYHYAQYRTAFLAELGAAASGWSEDQVKLAFCCVWAYNNSSYGSEPDSWDLSVLLAASTLACDRYVTLMWLLYGQMTGVNTDIQAAIGVNGGYAGNHAQLLSMAPVPILMDPTIGFLVTGVSFDSLFKGQGVPINNFRSFYFRSELDTFKQTISEALYYGYYKPSDLLYYVPKLSNWNLENLARLTTVQKWVVQP